MSQIKLQYNYSKLLLFKLLIYLNMYLIIYSILLKL